MKKEKKKTQFDENKWEELYIIGGLDKLLVEDLNKYLDNHDIDKAHKLKNRKLKIIKFQLHEKTWKLECYRGDGKTNCAVCGRANGRK